MTSSGNSRLPRRVQAFFEERAHDGFDAFLLSHLYGALNGRPLDLADGQLLESLAQEYGLERGKLGRLEPIYNECVSQVAGDVAPAGNAEPQARRKLKASSLDAAIERVAPTLREQLIAKQLARQLRGHKVPGQAQAKDLAQRIAIAPEDFEVASLHYALALSLYRDGVRSWNRGFRRRKQQYRMSFVLPSALARRIPVITNNHWDGPVNGDDIYGPLRCSEPLRPGAVGALMYILGIASDQERFKDYKQIDEDGRVHTSAGRIYQAIAAIDANGVAGGAGHKCVSEWVGQLTRLELEAVFLDEKKISEHVEDLSIPSSPIDLVEKLVEDDDGELVWVSFLDPRSATRKAEFTLRFTIAEWCQRRIGYEKQEGDRIFFDPGVWRCLSPAGRAMYMVAQGTPSKMRRDGRREAQWWAADPWCMRFGMTGWADPTDPKKRLGVVDHEKRNLFILDGLNDLYWTDDRVTGYARPWNGHNGPGMDYAVFVDGRSKPRKEMRDRLRRADLRMQLLEYEQGADGLLWLGDRSRQELSNAPPGDT